MSRIFSYDVLVERCADAVEDEMKRVEQRDIRRGRLLIIGNAPTFGNVSARESYGRLYRALERAFNDERITVKVLCLKWLWIVPHDGGEVPNAEIAPRDLRHVDDDAIRGTPLGEFYFSWCTEGDASMTQRVRVAWSEAVVLLDVLRHARTSRDPKTWKEAYAFSDGYAPLHALITSRRALLWHTLEIPVSGAPRSRVDVLGSDTCDAAVMASLEDAFRFHTTSDKAERIIPGPP